MTTLDTLRTHSRNTRYPREDVVWLMVCLAIIMPLMGTSFTLAALLEISPTTALISLNWFLASHTLIMYVLRGHMIVATTLPLHVGSILLTTALTFMLSLPIQAINPDNALFRAAQITGLMSLPLSTHLMMQIPLKTLSDYTRQRFMVSAEQIATLVVELGSLARELHDIRTPQISIQITRKNKPFALSEWAAAVQDQNNQGVWHSLPVQDITLTPTSMVIANTEHERDHHKMYLIATPPPLSAHEHMALIAKRHTQ